MLVSVVDIIMLVASFFAVVIVLTLHEFSHAYVAYRCGDPTAKYSGRLTLNPLKHFDLIGLLAFTIVGFGWAKPVPVNPNNFRKYRLGSGLTACAGVAMNFVTAIFFYPIFLVVLHYLPADIPVLSDFLNYFTYYLFAYSLSFCAFNLLPFHPLDGFRIVEATSRRHGKIYQFLRRYGHWVLLGLIAESFLCKLFVRVGVPVMDYFDVLGWIMRFATGILGYPIQALWGLIPW